MSRSFSFASAVRFAAGALAAIALAGVAQAAEAPAQAWPTEVSGDGGTVGDTRAINWQSSPYGNPGVSATQTITSIVAVPSLGCPPYMTGTYTGASINSAPNVPAFIEPDMPASALMLAGCIEGDKGYVSSLQFNKPLIAPIFHFYNLDSSRFAIAGTSTTGAAVGLTPIVRNNLLDISGTTVNNTVQPATAVGCNNNTGTDAGNGACGSIRVTAASGLIQTLTLNSNATPPSGPPGSAGSNDGHAWTLSFPTAPLTKQFSPEAIAAGQTSQLTFSIANPNQSGSVTLTPLDFTDNLPAGVTLASATATNNGSCGTPTVTNGAGGALAVGATSVRATNISVAPGATCTVTITVTADAGSYTNDTSNLSSSVGNLIPGGSTTLIVTEPEVDLAITKDDGSDTYVPGLDVIYTIVVSNNGPSAVVGARVSDPLPPGITTASWTCGNATGGGVCGAPSGTGAIDSTADLPVGASVTYILSLAIPADYTASLTNTATVTPPDGMTDTNLDNNEASDTDTMEPPPTSGACAPREVAPGSTFSLAPFANGGTVTKSAGVWATAPTSEWYKLGGDYTLTWNFTQPIPADWLQIILVDIDSVSPNGTLTISLGGGVSTNQIVKVGGDLLLGAGGVVRRDGAITGDPGQSGTFRFAPGGTLTSITITSANIASNDNIGNRLQVRPACLTLEKLSEGGAGAFTIDMTNVAQADGTAVPSTTLTTTTPGTPVSSTMLFFSPVPGAVMALSETVPEGWDNTAGVCTDQNASVTGNPVVIGSFASPTISIPADNVRPQADIHCRFTNDALPAADLAIVKTVAPNDVAPGDEVVYTMEVTNNGPEAADGALVTDPGVPSSLNCTALTCAAAAGAVCPGGAPTPAQLAAGLAIPTFPVGGTITLELTCTVTATGF